MSDKALSFKTSETKEKFENMPPDTKESVKNGHPPEMKVKKLPAGVIRRKSGMGDEVDDATKKIQKKNLQIMIAIMSFTMLSYGTFIGTYQQWVLVRFQEEALGDDFAKLNISAAQDPCYRDNGTTTPYAEQLAEAQAAAARLGVYTNMVDILPSVISNLLIGAYSDRLGRRFIFIISITGGLIRTAVTVVVAFWHLNIYTILAGAFVNGCCGDIVAMFLGVFIYTADNTSGQKRAMAMVFAQGLMLITGNLARIANGYFILAVGYEWPMFTGFCLYVIALFITIFFLRETLDKSKIKGSPALVENIKRVFSFYMDKPRDPNHRRSDFFILAIAMLVFGVSTSDNITTIFLMNQPLCWSSTKQGLVLSITGIVTGVGSYVILAGLKRCVSDEVAAIICIVSSTVKNFIFSFAGTDLEIYAGLSVGILEMSAVALIRAVLSKLVVPEKRGSLFASIAVVDVGTRAMGTSGLNELYAVSVATWRGLTFFTVGVLAAIAGAIMVLYKIIISQRKVPETNIEIALDDTNKMKGAEKSGPDRKVHITDSSTWTGEDNEVFDERL